MDMLVRGRHVITDPAVGDPGVLDDGALSPDAAEPFYVLNRRR